MNKLKEGAFSKKFLVLGQIKEWAFIETSGLENMALALQDKLTQVTNRCYHTDTVGKLLQFKAFIELRKSNQDACGRRNWSIYMNKSTYIDHDESAINVSHNNVEGVTSSCIRHQSTSFGSFRIIIV